MLTIWKSFRVDGQSGTGNAITEYGTDIEDVWSFRSQTGDSSRIIVLRYNSLASRLV